MPSTETVQTRKQCCCVETASTRDPLRVPAKLRLLLLLHMALYGHGGHSMSCPPDQHQGRAHDADGFATGSGRARPRADVADCAEQVFVNNLLAIDLGGVHGKQV